MRYPAHYPKQKQMKGSTEVNPVSCRIIYIFFCDAEGSMPVNVLNICDRGACFVKHAGREKSVSSGIACRYHSGSWFAAVIMFADITVAVGLQL